MKGKVTRGMSFAGALKYASDATPKPSENKHAVLIDSNLDTSQTIENQAWQMRKIAMLNPRIAKPVVHFALSLPLGETVSNEKWAVIGRDFLNAMGLDESHQFRIDLHPDAKQHIHIICNRVSVGGKAWLGKYEALKMIEATQQLEKKHGLNITEGLVFGEKKKNPKSGELRKYARTGKVPPRIFLQSAIDTAKIQANSFPQFVDALKKLGVQVLPAGKTGSVPGCSFSFDGITFKGSDLGGAYKFAAIKEATNYDQLRDAALIQELRSAAPAALVAPAAPLDPYAGRPGPRKNRGSIECGDDEAAFEKARRRKDFQQRMLEKTYQTSINSLLVDMLRYVRIVNGQVEISLEPGGKIIDSGDSITASTGSGDEIKASIELAKTKGWKTIQFSGSASFVERAALAAMKNGFPESSVSAKNQVHQAAIKRAKLKYSEYQNEHNQRNARASDRANSERIDAAGPGTTSEERARNRAELGKTDLGQGGKSLPSPASAQAEGARRVSKPSILGKTLADFNADGRRSDDTLVDRDRSKF